MKNKAYLFDFDGTLVDSMPFWAEKMLKILDEAKVSYPENIIEIITPLGDKGTADYFIDKLGVIAESREALVESMNETGYPYYRDIIGLKEGVYDYLVKMKKEGYSLNVLTASPHLMLDVCLIRNGVFDLFDNVWSCEDFNTTKADPEIYKMAAERMGVDISDVVFFDDNIGAIRTAKSVGVFTVGIHDKSGERFTDDLKQTADLYFDSFLGKTSV